MESISGNISYTSGSKDIKFGRHYLSKYEYRKWKNKRFTGFKVTWECTNCNNSTKSNYNEKHENKLFVKIANLVHEGIQKGKIWAALKEAKLSQHSEIQAFAKFYFLQAHHFAEFMSFSKLM